MSKRKDVLKKLLSVTLAVCMTVPMWSAPFAEDAAPVSSSSDTTVSSSSDATDLDLSGAADPDADGAAVPSSSDAADPDADGAADPDADGAADPDADGAADPDADGAADPDTDGAAVPDTDGAADPDADGHPVEADKSVTAWTWDDPDGLLQQDGDAWVLGLAGVSELTDDVWAKIRDTLLPQAVTATVDGATETVALTWTLTGSTAMAALAEGYTLAETAPALTVRLETGGATTYANPAPATVTTPQNINGTTIDVFDYWLTTQSASDQSNPYDQPGYYYYYDNSGKIQWWDGASSNLIHTSGINKGHMLLFGSGMDGIGARESASLDAPYIIQSKNIAARTGSIPTGDYGDYNNGGYWNGWSGWGNGPIIGIVSPTLNDEGFPTLALDSANRWLTDNALTNTATGYNSNSLEGRNRTESLAYLFDPDSAQAGKASFTNVGGLLQIDNDGYYYYDSRQNFASLVDGMNEQQKQQLQGSSGGLVIDGLNFVLYSRPGVRAGGMSNNGQFFPFNSAHDTSTYSETSYVSGIFPNAQLNWDENLSHNDGENYPAVMNSTNSVINHYFGVHMQTRFVQQYGGHVADTTVQTDADPVTYEFSGDDDVWIFIDGVLVADLGGIHDAVKVTINFSTGEIEISSASTHGTRFGAYETTLHEQFNDAKKQVDWEEKTKDGETYYIFPDDTYHTLDFFYLERGNTDSNMYLKYNLVTIPESNLIKVDQLGNPVEGATFELYSVTDKDKPDAVPIATGTTDANGRFVFVREDGSGKEYPITLQYLYEHYGKGKKDGETALILRERNDLPGYRSPGDIELYFYKAAADTAADEVLLLSNSIWDEGAYAMAKVTTTLPNEIQLLQNNNGNWEKWALVDLKEETNPVLFAVVFQKQNDGTWLPVSGDPLNGWTVAKDNKWESVLAAAQANPYEFHVASSGAYQVEVSNLPGDIKTYYHFTGSEANAKYTIAYYYSEANTLAEANQYNTHRIDSENAAYPLDRVFSMNLYVTNVQNRLLVQKVDETGTPLNGAEFALYKADDVTVDNGTVTVKENASPYDSLTTASITGVLNLEGGGIFPTTGHILVAGEYYLIETDAPGGYIKAETAVHVIVDDTGVYADAGTANDGVSVLRGVGSVMRSLVQFAAGDHVDTTLNGIQAILAENVTYTDGSFIWTEPSDWTNALHLQFANANKMLDYGLYSGTGNATIDDLTLETTEGWSKLLIRQCYRHDNATDTSLKTELLDDTNQPLDITNLFSGTVTVRVVNHSNALNISKKVNDPAGYDIPTYSFTVSGDLSGPYSYTVTKDGETAPQETGKVTFNNGAVTQAKKEDGAGSAYWQTGTGPNLQLGDGEHMIVKNIAAGTEVTVTENPDEAWAPFCDTTVKVAGRDVELNEDDPIAGTVTMAADSENTIEFTNTFRTGSITVRKVGVVYGEGTEPTESPLTGAVFTLYVGATEDTLMKKYSGKTEYYNRVDYTESDSNVTYDPNTNLVTVESKGETTSYTAYTDTNGQRYYYVPLAEGQQPNKNTVAITTFRNLPLSFYYKLEETDVPVGYRGDALTIKWDDDTQVNLESAFQFKDFYKDKTLPASMAPVDVQFKAKNTKLELPSSGGHGVVTVTALGFAMILGGGALLATSRKRKKN